MIISPAELLLLIIAAFVAAKIATEVQVARRMIPVGFRAKNSRPAKTDEISSASE